MIALFILTGCNEQAATTGSSSASSNEKPPSLTLIVDEKEINMQRGGYSWSYFDKESGQTVTTETDHAPPNEMVNIEDGIALHLEEGISLNFEIEPNNYEIQLWDATEVIATYKEFADIEQRGKYIVVVIGNWEEDTVTYVKAFDIQ